MDALLGNYGLDEEEEEPQQQRERKAIVMTTSAQPGPSSYSANKTTPSVSTHHPKSTATGSAQVAPVPGQKKRKLLDISILPEHIQRALIQGASLIGDSDDEDVHAKTTSNNSSAPSEANKARSKTNAQVLSDPLLAILPAPSNHKEDPRNAFKVHTKPIVKESEDLEEEEGEGLLGRSIGSTKSEILLPLLTRQSTSVPDSMHPSTLHRQLYQHHYSAQEASLHPPEYSPDNQSSGEAQRKRQRNLEQMLMSGNLAVLEQGVSVREIQVGNQWDAFEYSEQKQREAAIYNQYTAGGTVKSAVQPTRQQNRKHQLTSLAMKAAETEIAMLDAHIAHSKTKSQTQSRYGW